MKNEKKRFIPKIYKKGTFTPTGIDGWVFVGRTDKDADIPVSPVEKLPILETTRDRRVLVGGVEIVEWSSECKKGMLPR